MIVVRDVFNLKFGKAKQAISLTKPMIDKMNSANKGKYRLLTDLVGNYYTLVFEGTFNSIEDYWNMEDGMNEEEWREYYSKFTELVESGYRDIWNVVE